MCFYTIGVHQPRKKLLATVTWKCGSSHPEAHSCELQRIKKNLDHVKDIGKKRGVKGHVWEREIWFAIPFIIFHLSYRLGSHPSKWNMLMRETEMRGSKGYRRKEWLVKWKEENGRGSGRKGERGRERKEVLWQPNEERGWEPDSIPQQINAACWRPQQQRQQPWMQKRSLQSIRRAASPPPVTEWWKAAPVTALPSLLSLSLSLTSLAPRQASCYSEFVNTRLHRVHLWA